MLGIRKKRVVFGFNRDNPTPPPSRVDNKMIMEYDCGRRPVSHRIIWRRVGCRRAGTSRGVLKTGFRRRNVQSVSFCENGLTIRTERIIIIIIIIIVIIIALLLAVFTVFQRKLTVKRG